MIQAGIKNKYGFDIRVSSRYGWFRSSGDLIPPPWTARGGGDLVDPFRPGQAGVVRPSIAPAISQSITLAPRRLVVVMKSLTTTISAPRTASAAVLIAVSLLKMAQQVM